MKHRLLVRHFASPFFYRVYDELRTLRQMIFGRKPLYDRSSLSKQPFFIVGSGRSGNTLLRAILTVHPHISIPPESYVLGQVVREYKRISYLPWKNVSAIIISIFEAHPEFITWELDLKPVYAQVRSLEQSEQNLFNIIYTIYQAYSEQKSPGALYWGDKTPLNTLSLDWLDQAFPRAKYIHLLRDGRDVVSSYLKAGIYTDVDDACERWLLSTAKARKFGRTRLQDDYIEVRYEDLVSRPEAIVKELCEFLSVNYRAQMLEHWQHVPGLGDVSTRAHHANVMQPISTASIGKWRDDLDVEAQRTVAAKLARQLRDLRYS